MSNPLVAIDPEPPSEDPPHHAPVRLTGPARFGATAEQWADWRWQLRHAVRSTRKLKEALDEAPDPNDPQSGSRSSFPMSVTPYYTTLIHAGDPTDPIRRCVLPSLSERVVSPEELPDPLGEDDDSPIPGLVHRYPDRALLLATDRCPVYCRYCTRSRSVGRSRKEVNLDDRLDAAIAYIRDHRELRDVLVSGGDPLVMDDDRIEHLLRRLREIPHVEIIRVGTKTPAVLPQRITPSLTRILSRVHPLWMNLHFTHSRELTAETHRACAALADSGIPLGSQTVLLRGVNDDLDTMRALFQGLLRFRVRPYYLYQCDRTPGSASFATPLRTGLDIIRGLRGFTSGLAVPQLVIDAPSGGGKIPLLPSGVISVEETGIHLRSYSGKHCFYPTVADGSSSIECLERSEEVRA